MTTATLMSCVLVPRAVPAPPRRAVPPPKPAPTRPTQPPPTPAQPPAPAPAAGPGGPLAGLDASTLARFNVGRGAFLEPFTPPQGLGPVFTEAACAKCHNTPAPGGSGQRLVTHFGRMVGGQFDPMVAFGGPQLQDRGIGPFGGVNFVGERVPPQATVVAERRTIPMFGLGLVDAVPDAEFAAVVHQEQLHNPLTAGRQNFVVDPATGQSRMGKFGWKAQEPTLLAFTADANVNEMGITSPLFPQENCPQGNCALLAANPARTNPNDLNLVVIQQQTDFTTLLAPPPRGPVGPAEQVGAALFAAIGCTDCHRPSLATGFSPIPALSGVTFSPYSDFLLHDMGTLGDGIAQNNAGIREMRTAPLWGLRFQHSYLHDGRAHTPEQAILDHDGQAATARNHFNALNATQKAQLLAFLNSL